MIFELTATPSMREGAAGNALATLQAKEAMIASETNNIWFNILPQKYLSIFVGQGGLWRGHSIVFFVLGGVRLLDVGMIAQCTALTLSCEFHVLSWNTIWQKKIRQDASEIWYWTMIVLMGKCSIYHNWYFMDFTSCHQLRKAYEWDRKLVFLWICV